MRITPSALAALNNLYEKQYILYISQIDLLHVYIFIVELVTIYCYMFLYYLWNLLQTQSRDIGDFNYAVDKYS